MTVRPKSTLDHSIATKVNECLKQEELCFHFYLVSQRFKRLPASIPPPTHQVPKMLIDQHCVCNMSTLMIEFN